MYNNLNDSRSAVEQTPSFSDRDEPTSLLALPSVSECLSEIVNVGGEILVSVTGSVAQHAEGVRAVSRPPRPLGCPKAREKWELTKLRLLLDCHLLRITAISQCGKCCKHCLALFK